MNDQRICEILSGVASEVIRVAVLIQCVNHLSRSVVIEWTFWNYIAAAAVYDYTIGRIVNSIDRKRSDQQ